MSNPQRSVIFRNKDFTVKKPEEKQVSAGFSYNMVLVDSVWGGSEYSVDYHGQLLPLKLMNGIVI